MRNFSKEVVFTFDHAVRKHVSKEKLDTFLEVFKLINDLIATKKIYTKKNESITS